MKLILNRIFLSKEATVGELFVNDKKQCNTLEDIVRPDGEKVYGKTAIPTGTYEIKLTNSPRFKKVLPEILNVPNFAGVRIHTGNSSKDTEGCLLVGTWDGKNENWISNSKAAFDNLMSLLTKAEDNKEKITITINNSWK